MQIHLIGKQNNAWFQQNYFYWSNLHSVKHTGPTIYLRQSNFDL